MASMIEGKENDVFILASPTIRFTEPVYCLKYWYLGYGEKVRDLRVDLYSSTDADRKELRTRFEKSENMIDWKYSQIQIDAVHLTENLQEAVFVFHTKRGADFRSDLAIDDIQLDPEACPLFPMPPPKTTTAPIGSTTAWTPAMSFKDSVSSLISNP